MELHSFTCAYGLPGWKEGHYNASTHISSRPGRTCLRVQGSKLRWQPADYNDLSSFHKPVCT